MDGFVLKLFNMSLAAGWMILAVILLRLLFRKAPRWIFCLAWGLVGLRLLLPFTIPSPASLVPSEETVQVMEEAGGVRTPVLDSGIRAIDDAVNPVIRGRAAEEKPAAESETAPSAGTAKPFPVFALIWAAGAAAMLLYSAGSFLALRRKVGAGIRVEKDVWIADGVKSPFILGVFRPRIYLPPTLPGAERECVLAHERAHLARGDHWWKPLGWILLSVYWFNPLLWVAYILLCRDIEFACDEKVIRGMDRERTAEYSAALLAVSAPGHRIAACPLAFGEVGTKKRIQSVLSYKKPAFWIILAAILALSAAAVCLLTGPLRKGEKPETELSAEVQAALEKSIPRQMEATMREPDDTYTTSDYVVLGTEEKGNEITVYLWIYYGTYVEKDGGVQKTVSAGSPASVTMKPSDSPAFEETTASHIPTAVTLRKVQKGDTTNYVTAEFWEPRDGGYYTKDIKKKFPRSLWDKAFDSQWCVAEQSGRCEKKAEEWFRRGYPTLDDVIRLSREKGQELTWGDFADYRYSVTGSGMYIRLFRMEEDFSLWVGGTSNKPDPKGNPEYIYLFHGGTWLESQEADWVDLRTGDVRAFIEKMRGKTPGEGEKETETGETDGLTALSPVEDWIAGTGTGPERDERLATLLHARSEYVKGQYLRPSYSTETDKATVTWKGGSVEITDPEKLAALASLLAPEKLRAAVLSPEIDKAASAEGGLPSEEFQKEETLYGSYGTTENLLLDLHNGTVIGILYGLTDKRETTQLTIGRAGQYDSGDDCVSITPYDETALPFPANPGCYLTGRDIESLLKELLSSRGNTAAEAELRQELDRRIEYYWPFMETRRKLEEGKIKQELISAAEEENEEFLIRMNYLTMVEKRYLAGEDPEVLLTASRNFRIPGIAEWRERLEKESWWDEVWNGGKLIPFTYDGETYSDELS